MATSNFYFYNDLLNIYFKSLDDLYEICYLQKYDDEETEKYVDENCDRYCVLDEQDIIDIQETIDECNKIIKDKYERLYYYSNRQCDYQQAIDMQDIYIKIESGYYEGYQIALNDYSSYRYLNKTNRKMISDLFKKIAKEHHLPIYDLAYRFSNGETGFTKIKQY